ncbi:MAG TPA: tyrosine--tRNA ligase [Firmicutes bacterium]|nr:tyrosine--tRNA ligase [Bacillota bacterium]
MANVFDVLQERGFIAQTTHEEELRELLGKEKVTFYVGFDPTADSLHVGHFLTIMAMAHMQRHGHRPIALIGGGTAMVGDPTGKTEMRKMLSQETIQANGECFKQQLGRFLDFSADQAIMVNNADWLLELKYVDVLREIGVHFSVNRMLTAECFKARWERGLSFLEFNYMLMQSYDFLELYRRFGCCLQLGGDDQWSNIISGADLIRRKESAAAYGLTLRLLTTSTGKKMGKTESGAVWLDAQKTSPFEFYQYWRNVDDADVAHLLGLLTFIPMEEVRCLGALEGEEINEAKRVLAYEVTKLVHGESAAKSAMKDAEALFGGKGDASNIPTATITTLDVGEGAPLLDILDKAGIIASKSEGRRLIDQGGLYLNDERVSAVDAVLEPGDFAAGAIIVRKGKKSYHQLVLAE